MKNKNPKNPKIPQKNKRNYFFSFENVHFDDTSLHSKKPKKNLP